MKRILTLVVVALSLLVSSTAFAKPTRAAPVRIQKARSGYVLNAKVLKKVRPALKGAAKPSAKPSKPAAKPARITKAKRPALRIPRVKK